MEKQYESYTVGALDEIDRFLEREFGIIPGCCSSIESLKYSLARAVAEKLWKKYEVQGR